MLSPSQLFSPSQPLLPSQSFLKSHRGSISVGEGRRNHRRGSISVGEGRCIDQEAAGHANGGMPLDANAPSPTLLLRFLSHQLLSQLLRFLLRQPLSQPLPSPPPIQSLIQPTSRPCTPSPLLRCRYAQTPSRLFLPRQHFSPLVQCRRSRQVARCFSAAAAPFSSMVVLTLGPVHCALLVCHSRRLLRSIPLPKPRWPLPAPTPPQPHRRLCEC